MVAVVEVDDAKCSGGDGSSISQEQLCRRVSIDSAPNVGQRWRYYEFQAVDTHLGEHQIRPPAYMRTFR